MNVYSETFFVVGEDKIKASDETKQEKPWLNEVIICFLIFIRNSLKLKKIQQMTFASKSMESSVLFS
jgi:hypothetical protein